MADLTTSVTENVTINGSVRGSTNTVTTTGINNVYERVVSCTTGQTTHIATFDTNSYGSAVQIDKENVRYIRVTNLDSTNNLELAVVGAATLYQVLFKAGQSHILCAADDVMLAEADAVPTYGSLADITKLEVRPTASTAVNVEIFVATV